LETKIHRRYGKMSGILGNTVVTIPVLEDGSHLICVGYAELNQMDGEEIFFIWSEEPSAGPETNCVPHVAKMVGSGADIDFMELAIKEVAFHEGGYPRIINTEYGRFTLPQRNFRAHPSFNGVKIPRMIFF
jgi:hypothetical protein